jgi:nucleotide-binding universal stress UspA family protein
VASRLHEHPGAPPPAAAVGYRRVLVPVVEGEVSDRALDLACRLASEHGAVVVALAAVELPLELPLQVHVDEAEAEARTLVGRAEAVGDAYGLPLVGRVVRARSAAEAIVEEARQLDAEVVVVGTRLRRRRHSLRYGPTVEHVLRNAPCRVLVVADPAA